jgi:hypothetical protein
MKDKNTPDIPAENTTAFVNGDDYVTVWDDRGIQHAEDTWSPEPSKNFIYLGADFSSIFKGKDAGDTVSFKTSTLRIELFYE